MTKPQGTQGAAAGHACGSPRVSQTGRGTGGRVLYHEQGLWVRKATPTETVPTVYNGLWLTAALAEKRGTYGDDPAVDIR